MPRTPLPKSLSCTIPWIAACLTIGLTGCLPFLRSVKEPLPIELLANPTDAHCTVFLLPGFWDRPKDFARQGFERELLERDLNVRLMAADAHVGYYRKRTILNEMRSAITKERTAGREVWLAGNSLGGVGSLILARHGGDVEGVLLMAPYLGESETLAEIRTAGGALAWAPTGTPMPGQTLEPGDLDREEYARSTWIWLADWYRSGQGSDEDSPKIWLGWGEDDDFAVAAEMAAALLPDGHALPAPGGHDWRAWTKNWRDFLDSGALDGCAL